jgi:hypothetical protein
MARRTKVLSGEGVRRFFRAMFLAESGVSPAAAQRLTDTCAREIAEVRVRRAPVTRRGGGEAASVGELPAAEAAVVGATAPVPAATAAPPAPIVAPIVAATEPVPAAAPAPAPAETAPAFDPFAFSLIVVMRRAGKAGLLDKLATVASVDHLRQIARAQHVGIPDDVTDIDALRAAIVAGTERRIAHREAAAS